MANQKSHKSQLNGANRTHPRSGSFFLSLELEHLRCFSTKHVLDLSDGEGRPARWIILLGANGTGKTTILQLLAAFDRATEPIQGVSFTHGEKSELLFASPAPQGIARDSTEPVPRFSMNAILGSNLANISSKQRPRCSGPKTANVPSVSRRFLMSPTVTSNISARRAAIDRHPKVHWFSLGTIGSPTIGPIFSFAAKSAINETNATSFRWPTPTSGRSPTIKTSRMNSLCSLTPQLKTRWFSLNFTRSTSAPSTATAAA
jgi:energy-coupling factor transporter ATP-binding protein EcfA2